MNFVPIQIQNHLFVYHQKESQNIFCHNLLFNLVASMIRIQISVPHPCIRIIPFSLSRLSSWFILGPFFLPPSIDVKNSTVRKAISERTVLILITVIHLFLTFPIYVKSYQFFHLIVLIISYTMHHF